VPLFADSGAMRRESEILFLHPPLEGEGRAPKVRGVG